MAEILVVDDDADICSSLEQVLRGMGHFPQVASNAPDALELVASRHPDLILLDLRLPGMDGLEALRAIRELDPAAVVVIMTAYGTSQTSIEAVRLGAFDHLAKPLDLDVVRPLIEKGLETRALSRAAPSGEAEKWKSYPLVNLVGKNARMQEVYKRIGALTTNDVPVLIRGEQGVGKELVARTIHYNSARREQPFVSVDCAVLPEAFLERQIFEGDPAVGGSQLLRNVDALSPVLQTKLLGLLDRPHGLQAVGGRPRLAFRVLATTSKDPEELVRLRRFDGELAALLGLVPIEIPPLRERVEDIPELVAFFIARCNADLGRAIRGAEERVMERLLEHPWPRNVGQLENAVRRACVLARGEVLTLDDFGESFEDQALPHREEVDAALAAAVGGVLRQRLREAGADPQASAFHEIVERVEGILIREALAQTGGNQVRAAALLNMNRTTLRKKMRPGDLD